jgi:hypothetical protein
MERLFIRSHEARTRLPHPLTPRAPQSAEHSTPVYCIVARGTDEASVAALRAYLGEQEISLVVDRRQDERRRTKRNRRRTLRLLSGRPAVERRWVRHADGRRVAERRTEPAPGPVALLPGGLARTLDRSRVRFVVASPVDPELQQDVAAARLVIRYQSGDRAAAFAELYESYAEPVHSFARASLRDTQEAEAICQQVFTIVARGLSSYELRSNPFRNWLFSIASNCIADRQRARRVEPLRPALREADRLQGWRRVDQPMRAAFMPRRLALGGFTRHQRAI